jgi:hypothetical protein
VAATEVKTIEQTIETARLNIGRDIETSVKAVLVEQISIGTIEPTRDLSIRTGKLK